MKAKTRVVFLTLALLIFCLSQLHCGNKKEQGEKEKLLYLNHHDTVKYVGMQACVQCHSDKHATFIHTGMGQSFDTASKSKSAASFEGHTAIYDRFSNFYYTPFWDKDGALNIREFRLEGKDTVHNRIEKIDYVIGSGQHTNSHIINVNGYLYQAPLTWYAQKAKWDLPPGFEEGNNSRFSRLIGFECMSCHNALPTHVPNSLNKFTKIPDGIDCERCHGPGELHIKEKKAGNLVDISKETDYTIVNPAKLPWNLQIDVCQRCHLQGNAVLKEGKDFDDFKPGMKLSTVMDVFMPKYRGEDDRFIMASHAERLQMSPCFIQSRERTSPLTCITCHNPHVSVKVTGKQVFNNACISCHKQDTCTEEPQRLRSFDYNCVQCHMPKSGTEDIPHVTVHDHFIRKPEKKEKLNEGVRVFLGLYAVNQTEYDALTRAKAYLQQYERFDRSDALLDSALFYIREAGNPSDELIHYYYLRYEPKKITSLDPETLQSVKTAWSLYRIARAFQNIGDINMADHWFEKACSSGPQNLDWLAEWSAVKLQKGEWKAAEQIINQVLQRNPKHTLSLNNKGFLYLNLNKIQQAREYLEKAVALNPDYELALYNLAVLYKSVNNQAKANEYAQKILRINSESERAKKILVN